MSDHEAAKENLEAYAKYAGYLEVEYETMYHRAMTLRQGEASQAVLKRVLDHWFDRQVAWAKCYYLGEGCIDE